MLNDLLQGILGGSVKLADKGMELLKGLLK
jgi:hypothetical protein